MNQSASTRIRRGIPREDTRRYSCAKENGQQVLHPRLEPWTSRTSKALAKSFQALAKSFVLLSQGRNVRTRWQGREPKLLAKVLAKSRALPWECDPWAENSTKNPI
ncbi:uncharacterized protein DS421_15g504950 [Arachis hypogaea]|nr:uncharacterized protein DS421_15g504950 [Arachis hypogaea]